MYKEFMSLAFFAFFFFILGYYVAYETPKPMAVYREKIEILRERKRIDEYFRKFPIYYINLERSKDRNENFIKEMKDYGMYNYQRINAVDGKEIKIHEHGEINGITYKANPNRTKIQLAVTLSHITAIIRGNEDGHENFMIMEDDAELTLVPYWKKSLNDIINEIPKDCDILLLSNHRFMKEKRLELVKIKQSRDLNGVCYIVTKRGMLKIMNRIRPSPTKDPPTSEVTIDLTSFPNNVFDGGFLSSFDVYTYNVTHFLLENFKYNSTVSNTQEGNINDVQKVSMQVLDNNSFIYDDIYNKGHNHQ